MLSEDNIRFKSENGCCPYFIYCGKKYYIKDVKINGKWHYRLEVKDLDNKKIMSFNSEEDGHKYILEKVNKQRYTSHNFSNLKGYITINYIYIQKANIVEIMKTANALTGEFENYIDCLNFAKSYIKNSGNSQIALLG